MLAKLTSCEVVRPSESSSWIMVSETGSRDSISRSLPSRALASLSTCSRRLSPKLWMATRAAIPSIILLIKSNKRPRFFRLSRQAILKSQFIIIYFVFRLKSIEHLFNLFSSHFIFTFLLAQKSNKKGHRPHNTPKRPGKP